MKFGLSTHLFHGERLTRAHMETIRANGFELVEIFATRTHLDYHDLRQVENLREWLDEFGLRASSVHGPICESFTHGVWGRSYSNASTQPARRDEAIAETQVAFEAARRLGASSVVVHLGLPRFQEVTADDNDPGAVRRSLDVLAEASAATGVRLALEVMPNFLSTPEALLDLLEEEQKPPAPVAHRICPDPQTTRRTLPRESWPQACDFSAGRLGPSMLLRTPTQKR